MKYKAIAAVSFGAGVVVSSLAYERRLARLTASEERLLKMIPLSILLRQRNQNLTEWMRWEATKTGSPPRDLFDYPRSI